MKKASGYYSALLRGAALGALTVGLLGACQSQTPEQKKQKALDDAASAQSDFDQAADRAPTPGTLYAMARILAAQGRDAECQSVLTKIIALQPDYMAAYNDLAELQMRQRKIDQAVGTLGAGLKIAPQQAVLLNNMGMCYMLKGQYEDSLTWFTRAAGAAPDDTRFRANMAMALGMSGRYDESLALYQQITTAADAHYNLGVLADSRKDHERAVKEYELAKSLEALSKDSSAKSQ
jgi:Flp pilus assembly protein TadD